MHSIRAFLSSTVSLLLFVGLTAVPGVLVPTPASAQDVLHEVQAGDDLRLLAGYYYGDTRQWERIWRANREIIRNPNRIERGSYLWILAPKQPTESYAAFVAQARMPAPAAAPPAGGIQVPKLEGEATAPGGVAPGAPAVAPRSAKAPSPPAPAKAPPAPAKSVAPAKAVPAAPGPAPAKAAPPALPQKPPGPAKAAAPPAKAPQPSTQPAKAAPAAPPAPVLQAKAGPAPAPAAKAAPPPATQPAKAPAPPAKRPLPPPPPPPKEWYEELMSPEIFTSVEFLGGVGALVLALVGLLVWRRRSAASAEEE